MGQLIVPPQKTPCTIVSLDPVIDSATPAGFVVVDVTDLLSHTSKANVVVLLYSKNSAVHDDTELLMVTVKLVEPPVNDKMYPASTSVAPVVATWQPAGCVEVPPVDEENVTLLLVFSSTIQTPRCPATVEVSEETVQVLLVHAVLLLCWTSVHVAQLGEHKSSIASSIFIQLHPVGSQRRAKYAPG